LTNTACIYQRKNAEEMIWCCINLDENPVDLPVNVDQNMEELLSNEKEKIENTVHLGPQSAKVLLF